MPEIADGESNASVRSKVNASIAATERTPSETVRGAPLKSTSAENQAGTAVDKFPDVAGAREIARADAGYTKTANFNAVRDGGTAAHVEVAAFINYVQTNAMRGHFEAGNFLFGAGVNHTVAGDLHLTSDANAVVTAASGYAPGRLFTFQGNADTPLSRKLHLELPLMDMRNMPNSGAGETNDGAYLTLPNARELFISYAADSGEDFRTAGGDSHVFLAGASQAIVVCRYARGAKDASFYGSADSTDSSTGSFYDLYGYFEYCENAGQCKRDVQTFNANIRIFRCLNGLGYADDAQVDGTEAIGGRGGIWRVAAFESQSSCYVNGGRDVIVDVEANDIGLNLTGGTPFASTAAQALRLGGAKNVRGRVIASGVNQALTRTSQFRAVTAEDRSIDGSDVPTTNCDVEITASGVGKAVHESGGADENVWRITKGAEANSVDSTLVGAASRIEECAGDRKVYALGGMPASFVSGTNVAHCVATGQHLTEFKAPGGSQRLYTDFSGSTIWAREIFSSSAMEYQWRVEENTVFSADRNGPKFPSADVATTGALTGLEATTVRYVSNGDGGSACLAVFDGTDWRRIVLGAAISAT